MAAFVDEVLHICSDHEHEETDMYCKSCKKPVCVQCVKNDHKEHEWDTKKNVMKKLRAWAKQRGLQVESFSQSIVIGVGEILGSLFDRSFQQFTSNCTELQSTRKELVMYVNEEIDKMKAKCEDYHSMKAEIIQEQRHKLKTKENRMNFLIHEMETGATDFTDFDLIEMHEELKGLLHELQSLAEVSSDLHDDRVCTGGSSDVSIITTIGSIEEKQSSQNPVLKHKFQYSEKENVGSRIRQIYPMTENEAWVHGDRTTLLKLVDSEGNEKMSVDMKCDCTDFTVDENDIYFLDGDANCLKTIDRDRKITSLFSTAPLVPTSIYLLRSGDVLLSAAERETINEGNYFVIRMSWTGDVINSYEIENERTSHRLFPWQVIEHFNGNICILIWYLDKTDTAEFTTIFSFDHNDTIVFKYGDEEETLSSESICCDIKGNTLAADPLNNRIHVIDAKGILVRYLFIEESYKISPHTIALHGNNLWVGDWTTGMIEVYNYAT